jgi:hypothetical protein
MLETQGREVATSDQYRRLQTVFEYLKASSTALPDYRLG